jgi:hypothetical protein
MLEVVLGQVSVAQPSPPGGLLDGRSMPLLAMTIMGLFGLAAVGLLYTRKRRLQKTVDERFKAFRAQAVSLMDELDGLRKRHKTLPETDPDFTVPMSGATLALYNRVNRDLDELWERWLKVMEIWDQTQRRIRAGSALASKPAEEARALLDGGEIDDLVRQSRFCKERLDHLNQGHEQARERLANARAELAAIQNAITRGTGVLLPSDPHHGEIEGAETLLGEAELMLAADPIGALEQISRSQQSLDRLAEDPLRRERRSYAPLSHPILDELAVAAERLRAAVGRLRITDLLGLVVKAWVALWVLGLVFALLIPLLVPMIFLAVFIFLVAGGWFFWRIMASWVIDGPRH